MMNKDTFLQLRVSQADLALYKQAADMDGDSLSGWVRRTLRQAVIRNLKPTSQAGRYEKTARRD